LKVGELKTQKLQNSLDRAALGIDDCLNVLFFNHKAHLFKDFLCTAESSNKHGKSQIAGYISRCWATHNGLREKAHTRTIQRVEIV
jgi:hypothetical protein